MSCPCWCDITNSSYSKLPIINRIVTTQPSTNTKELRKISYRVQCEQEEKIEEENMETLEKLIPTMENIKQIAIQGKKKYILLQHISHGNIYFKDKNILFKYTGSYNGNKQQLKLREDQMHSIQYNDYTYNNMQMNISFLEIKKYMINYTKSLDLDMVDNGDEIYFKW